MRFSEVCACVLVASYGYGVSAGYIARRDVSEVGEKNRKHLFMSFDKLRGSDADHASMQKRRVGHLKKRDDGGVEVEIENENTFYSVNLHIGTPAQEIGVLVDTGSSDLWVPGSGNPYCDSAKGKTQESGSGSNSNSNRAVSIAGEKRQDNGDLSSLIVALSSALQSELSGVYLTTLTDLDGTDGSGAAATRTATAAGSLGSAGGGVGTSSRYVPASKATLDCSEYGTFDSGKSSTWQSNRTRFYISYADGTFADGVWGLDHMHLDDIDVSGLSFAVSNYTDSQFGVLGIGLPGSESTYSGQLSSYNRYQYDNFPIVLYRNGVIDRVAYSVFLNDLDADSGDILFGAVDHSKYTGTLYTIPLVNSLESKGYSSIIRLSVTLQGIGITGGDADNVTVTETKYPALLDTGATFCYFPRAVASAIAAEVGATYSAGTGYYLISCNADKDYELVFDFGGFHIKSPLKNYIIETSGSSSCVLGVLPQSDNEITLGDAFLTNAYVVYDLEDLEISLAQADYSDKDSQIEVIKESVPNAVKAPGYSDTWSVSESFSSGGNIFTVSGSNNSTSPTTTASRSRENATNSGSRSSTSSGRSSSTSSSSSKSNEGFVLASPSKASLVLMILAIAVSPLLL